MPRPSRAAIFRVVVALLGLVILVSTVRAAGPAQVWEILVGAAVWIPLAAALELARIGSDALATRLLLGLRGKDIPAMRLLAAHVAAHAVMNVFPAGRSSSEVVKGTLLAPWLGVGPAVAMGTANQANVLISSALFSLPCAVAAALVSDDVRLPIAIVAHFVVLMLSGIGLRVLATNAHIERFVVRRLPRLAPRLASFHEASRESALIAWPPVLAMGLGRGMQTLEYALLAYAVGIDVTVLGALAVQGTNLVAAAIGVLVPGQLGSAEAVFALAATALSTTVARATSVALLAHVLSFFWVAVGLVIVLAWRGQGARAPGPAASAAPSHE